MEKLHIFYSFYHYLEISLNKEQGKTITSCKCVSSGGRKGKKPRATQPLIGSDDVESDDVVVPG